MEPLLVLPLSRSSSCSRCSCWSCGGAGRLVAGDARRASGSGARSSDLGGAWRSPLSEIVGRIDAVRRGEVGARAIGRDLAASTGRRGALHRGGPGAPRRRRRRADRDESSASWSAPNGRSRWWSTADRIQARRAAGARELEAQTAIKRGYLNLLHAREAIAPPAPSRRRARSWPPQPAPPESAIRRDRLAVDGSTTYVVVSSGTPQALVVLPRGGRMRCPQCGERETRVVDSRDLDEPPRSAGAASARPARRASRPTSASRPPGSSSSSVTARARSSTARSSPPGLRKALTRRPVAATRPTQAADEIEAELRSRGRDRGPIVADRRAGDGEAPRARPDRLHPLRQRLPELRRPRGAQARGRHALRRERRRRSRCGRPDGPK